MLMMNTTKNMYYTKKGRNKFTAISEKFRITSKSDSIGHDIVIDMKNIRDYEMELTGIKSTDEVMIDFTKVLNVKKGDLVII